MWWKKRFRLGEFLIEKAITAISFLSFAFIALIFVFVFRESLPVFWQNDHAKPVETEQVQQETYGDVSSAEEQQQEIEKRAQSVENFEEGRATGTLRRWSVTAISGVPT